MTATMYAIPNCDTVKKARDWLTAHGIEYKFHDYKKSGASEMVLDRAIEEYGWDNVLNRAGTTFKNLPEADKKGLDRRKAIALMMASPSMIKRPILVAGDRILVGFKPEAYETLL